LKNDKDNLMKKR